MQSLSSPSPYAEAWETNVRTDYRAMSPRALVVEILELRFELIAAEVYDPVTQEVVALLAGRRLTLAQDELRRRATERRA